MIERYGTPAEVARAYVEAELHPRMTPAWQARAAQEAWEPPICLFLKVTEPIFMG